MAGTPGTSLVLRERDAYAPDRWVLRRSLVAADHCDRMPFDYVNTSTGAIRPASCKSIRCPTCGAFEVKRRAWRIAKAEPERFLTLTNLPVDFQSARRVEARFLRLVRVAGYDVEWAIAHELTKSGRRHAHALTKGSYVPQRELSALAERAGMGRVVYISAIRNEGATNYALKEALRVVKYATKGASALDDHLSLNGGRLCRTTRGYFR
jgi:hypothetical protein